MKKTLTILICLLIILLPINVSANEERFETIQDFAEYFYAHNKFPDYYCGMWSNDGTMYNITVSVVEGEDGERGKQEILDWVKEDANLTFAYGKHSFNFLKSLQEKLMKELKDYGIACSGILEKENVLDIGILSEYKENPETQQKLTEVKKLYGDAVEIRYTEGVFFQDDIIHYTSAIFEPDKNTIDLKLYLVLGTVLLLSSALVFILMRKRRVLIDANGKTYESTLTEKEVEKIVKNTEPQVPSYLEERIFKEIHKSR